MKWLVLFIIPVFSYSAYSQNRDLFFSFETTISVDNRMGWANSQWHSSLNPESQEFIQNTLSSTVLKMHEEVRNKLLNDVEFYSCMHTLLAATGYKHKLVFIVSNRKDAPYEFASGLKNPRYLNFVLVRSNMHGYDDLHILSMTTPDDSSRFPYYINRECKARATLYLNLLHRIGIEKNRVEELLVDKSQLERSDYRESSDYSEIQKTELREIKNLPSFQDGIYLSPNYAQKLGAPKEAIAALFGNYAAAQLFLKEYQEEAQSQDPVQFMKDHPFKLHELIEYKFYKVKKLYDSQLLTFSGAKEHFENNTYLMFQDGFSLEELIQMGVKHSELVRDFTPVHRLVDLVKFYQVHGKTLIQLVPLFENSELIAAGYTEREVIGTRLKYKYQNKDKK